MSKVMDRVVNFFTGLRLESCILQALVMELKNLKTQELGDEYDDQEIVVEGKLEKFDDRGETPRYIIRWFAGNGQITFVEFVTGGGHYVRYQCNWTMCSWGPHIISADISGQEFWSEYGSSIGQRLDMLNNDVESAFEKTPFLGNGVSISAKV